MELNSKGLSATTPGQGMLYRTKPGFALREVCGEWLTIPVALAPEEASRMAVLNEEGKFLWEQLQKERTRQELLDAITTEYEVDVAVASADLERFLTALDGAGLLEK